MNITIKAKHVKITNALKEYAEKKIAKLERFFDHIQQITITLDIEGASSEDDKHVATATIQASGTVLRASETSQSMYSSIDILHDKLETQLKKYKEKLKNRHKKASSTRHLKETGLAATTPNTSNTNHSKNLYIKKPMDIEDALTIFQENELPILVFREMAHEKICILYNKSENEYGLVET